MTDKVSDLAGKARQLGLAGDYSAAHALLDQAMDLAGDDAAGLARCAIERGRLYNSAGHKDAARPLFGEAWRLAREARAHALAADAAHMNAIAGTLGDAIEWTATGLAYVDDHPEAEIWSGPLLNNLGWSWFDAGRYEDALPVFEQAVTARHSHGQARELRIARYAVIRTLRALGRLEEALHLAEDVARAAEAGGEEAPYIHEELAECHAGLGDRQRARIAARRALAVLGNDAVFADREPRRLARLRELAG